MDRRPRLRRRRLDLEQLENRTLLNGAWEPSHDHEDSDRFKLPSNGDLIATADFNADGKTDVVNVNKFPPGRKAPKLVSVVLQKGLGTGVFVASSVNVLVASNPSAVVTGDFTGDGKTDVGVIAKVSDTSTVMYLLAGDGSGGLAAPTQVDLGAMSTSNISAADVDYDGITDLVSFDSSSVWIAASNGLGSVQPALQLSNPFPAGVVPIGLAEINGDGAAELIGSTVDLGARYAASFQVLSAFPITLGSSISLTDKRVVFADVNGDGLNDMIALGDGSVDVALNQSTLSDYQFAAWTHWDGPVNPEKTLVGDVNGDGKADLFRMGMNFGVVSVAKLVLISNGDGTFHKLWF